MAATAKNLDGSKIILGPGYLWADVGVPAAASRLTLASDGSPDSVGSPNAKNLGLTVGGCTVEFGLETQSFESDELTAEHLSRIVKQPISIKAELLQITDFANVMKYVMPGANYSTSTGYKQLTIGGSSVITTYSFALICADVADATKFIVVQLYKGYNKAPFSFNITRKDQAKASIEIVGQSIATRAEGDQTGNFWMQIA